ncbi:hypothetical protein QBC40DRAFT_73412 [Triangularia verruculosa]|uniref:Endoplasmic reticulum junction formation protein lunapark n=1 Tax=Triangularia verruculosa TaxID=2587418 RepID=A0AAN6XGD3_9PEZI|nr:hypothetical protein QBC40DRAFT_73412 [Triangularia verruculosa]
MVSLWPWGRDDSSPASFEKALSTLSTKITVTQTRLDQSRAKARRIKVLGTLYIGFAYLVYAIVLMLVVGYKNMGAWEWTGMAGGPVLISLVRSITTIFFDYRIERLGARLKDYQTERAKTIQKLKDATKYDSTLELLEKYGGSDNKQKKSRKKAEEEQQHEGAGPVKEQPQPRHHARTGLPPPPTANIQRRPESRAGTPQSRQPSSAFGGPIPQPSNPIMDESAEFAPNAFDGRAPPPFIQYPPATMAPPPEPHWYDRILDTLLGEDETAAKNRIVLICAKCRLVNGQAPPGTKSLAEIGKWKCMACGATNGEIDEGKRIVQEVLEGRGAGTKAESIAGTTDDEGRSSSEIVEVERDVATEPQGLSVRKREKRGQ